MNQICCVIFASIVLSLATTNEQLMDKLEMHEVQDTIDEILEENTIDIKQTIMDMLKGKIPFDMKDIIDMILSRLFSGIVQNRDIFIHILLFAVAGAIFHNFSEAFRNTQISEIGFYIIYMLLLAVLVKSFSSIAQIASIGVENLLDFMRALLPSYFLAITFSGGTVSSMVFYEIVLFIITAVEWLLKNLVIPMIHIYVVLVLVNDLLKEDTLSKLAELIKNIVEWLLKTLLAAVIGINIVQGMISPVIDSFKTGIFAKTASMLPGLGNVVNAATEVVLGAGILIKNGIGVAALIIIAFICIIPFVNIIVVTVIYQLSAAVIQPISDKRIVKSLTGIGTGARLLSKVVLTAGVMFLLTIAIITVSTNFRT
ncbi:stage III sporulation protein AE [Anaerosacchariphilus polymeriproducens]|nr:stage III sporulation protein AE [Anaerosacchariphilus polymeriproducens]